MTANSQIIPNRLYEIATVIPFIRQQNDSRLTPSHSRFIDFLMDTSHFEDGYWLRDFVSVFEAGQREQEFIARGYNNLG